MAAKTKTRYDIEQLLNDADMKEVAQEIGIKINYERRQEKILASYAKSGPHRSALWELFHQAG